MLNSIYVYGFLGLTIIALGVGFVEYYKYAQQEKMVLIEQRVKLELAVRLNEQTIKSLKVNMKEIADANKNLSTKLSDSERIAADDRNKINEKKTETDALAIEKRINDEYKNYNRDIEFRSRHQ